MASAVGLLGKNVTFARIQHMDRTFGNKKKRGAAQRNGAAFVKVSCSYRSPSMDPYKTLRIERSASVSEVKSAFRKLALQYHPDVCRGCDSDTEFQVINEAYQVVMGNLKGTSDEPYDQGSADEPMVGVDDPDCELWEEWMGWEGAGICDYSSHINPYI